MVMVSMQICVANDPTPISYINHKGHFPPRIFPMAKLESLALRFCEFAEICVIVRAVHDLLQCYRRARGILLDTPLLQQPNQTSSKPRNDSTLQQWCRKSERLSEIRSCDRRHPRILPSFRPAVRPFYTTRAGVALSIAIAASAGKDTICIQTVPASTPSSPALSFSVAHLLTNPAEDRRGATHSLC